jgi:hypothetical protein
MKITLKNKLYLVAMFGDVPEFHRRRLFHLGAMPVIPAVMGAAREMVSYIERIAASSPPGRKRGPDDRNRLK